MNTFHNSNDLQLKCFSKVSEKNMDVWFDSSLSRQTGKQQKYVLFCYVLHKAVFLIYRFAGRIYTCLKRYTLCLSGEGIRSPCILNEKRGIEI